MSPTARSLAKLRERGYVAGVVERWIAEPGIHVDLFGFLDIVAVKPGETVGVQATTGDHVAARLRKIEDSPSLPLVRAAGWRVVVHGWRKSAMGVWVLREVELP